jgi:tripartite-type tricarboxylate transporter receptor subunit TctC
MMTMNKRGLLRLAAAVSLAGAAFGSLAQSFPSQRIRILVPYEPGSSVDTTTRLLADGLSKRLGQTVIVENKTGGLGMIAMNALLNEPADGYTLLADTPASAINPSLYPDKVRYDPVADLQPVAQMMSLPFALAVSPSVPAKNLKEFIALAKAKPGELNAAPGGTSTRLAGELFAMKAGIKLTAIPYKGASSAMTAVMRDEAQAIFLDIANLKPYIESGKMRGLFVTGDKRWAALPDLPTAREAGMPEYDIGTWFALFARKGTPQPVVDRLNAEVRELMKSPEVRAYLDGRGASPSTRAAAEFTKFFHDEVALWKDVISKANIKIE